MQLHDYGCSLKVFRAEVVKPLKLYGEMHRFLPAIASEMGVTITEKVVNHRKRVHGTSKYGISRTIRVVLDLLTVKFLISYSTRPLQIFGLLGLGMGGLGALLSAWLVYREVRATSRDCRPAAAARGDRACWCMGVQFLMSGLIAEMQARTYHESQDKPIYVIREIREAPARPRGVRGRMRGCAGAGDCWRCAPARC